MAFESNGLGRRVIRRLHQLGMAQKDLVEKSEISQAAISHICTGRIKMVEAPAIFRLADALECDARWLATGETGEDE